MAYASIFLFSFVCNYVCLIYFTILRKTTTRFNEAASILFIFIIYYRSVGERLNGVTSYSIVPNISP